LSQDRNSLLFPVPGLTGNFVQGAETDMIIDWSKPESVRKFPVILNSAIFACYQEVAICLVARVTTFPARRVIRPNRSGSLHGRALLQGDLASPSRFSTRIVSRRMA
jgi:hypothetical protein